MAPSHGDKAAARCGPSGRASSLTSVPSAHNSGATARIGGRDRRPRASQTRARPGLGQVREISDDRQKRRSMGISLSLASVLVTSAKSRSLALKVFANPARRLAPLPAPDPQQASASFAPSSLAPTLKRATRWVDRTPVPGGVAADGFFVKQCSRILELIGLSLAVSSQAIVGELGGLMARPRSPRHRPGEFEREEQQCRGEAAVMPLGNVAIEFGDRRVARCPAGIKPLHRQARSPARSSIPHSAYRDREPRHRPFLRRLSATLALIIALERDAFRRPPVESR